MDLGAALIGLLIAFGVKIAVMFLGARLLLRLYKATAASAPKRLWLLLPRENLPEIRVLWWSLVCFCASEFTCGIEIYVLFHSNPVLTGIHSITSGVGMGLFAFGCYLFLDKELLRYGRPACLLNRICRGCTFAEPERCKFLHVIMFIGTFIALVAIAPFFTPTERMAADTTKYMLPFPALNAWYDGTFVPWLKTVYPAYQPSGAAYYLPASMSVIEFKLEPGIALLVAIAGIVALQRRRELLGTKLLVFAFGLLCYTYFELILYRATGDVLVGSLAHEVGELWFLLITAEFLRRAFDPGRRAGQPATNHVGATAA